MKRTHTCGELTINNINQEVILQGWVKKIRVLGKIAFIDLRDRYGVTQIIIDNDFLISNNLDVKSEYVIEVFGKVIERKSKNINLLTGDIEIEAQKIMIINKSELIPFAIEDNITALEDTKLKYRFLDLRRNEILENLKIRAKVNSIIRNFLEKELFLEIETPYFGKSTPEGSRDFLIPSRINKNKFYALPQSPQLYKQLLMISGMDKYYQIVRCFRDEDLRNDRQLEFTQLDMEMSFAKSSDVMSLIESMIKKIMFEIKGLKFDNPFLQITYKEAIDKYGSDKPDLRFGLEIHNLTHIFENTDIKFLQNNNSSIKGVFVEELLNKKQLEELSETAKQMSFNNIAFAKIDNGVWSGSISTLMNDTEKELLVKEFHIKNKGTILLNIGDDTKLSNMLGAIRCHVAKTLNLIKKEDYKILWVTDFPLFEYSEEENRYMAAHHPFTQPANQSLKDFDIDKKNALSCAYDIVINGYEIGGGSERITNPEIQTRMFKALELSEESIKNNFGWFIEAFKFGTPNHAGLALGLDRLIMVLTNSKSIRDVIAFPKNSSGIDPMSSAPDFVSKDQLNELNINTK